MGEIPLGNDSVICVLGGQYHEDYSNTSEMFSVDKNKWTVGPSLNFKRMLSTAVTVSSALYVLGGYLLDTSQIEKLEHASADEWQIINIGGYNHFSECCLCACSLDNRNILVFGGTNKESDGSRKSWVINLDSNKITDAGDLPSEESFL